MRRILPALAAIAALVSTGCVIVHEMDESQPLTVQVTFEQEPEGLNLAAPAPFSNDPIEYHLRVELLGHDRSPVSDFDGLAAAAAERDIVVLDTRAESEYADGHLDGAVNSPLHQLPHHVGDVPAGEIWVHCASGYRASIAASLLDREHRSVVLIDDDYNRATDLGLDTSKT